MQVRADWYCWISHRFRSKLFNRFKDCYDPAQHFIDDCLRNSLNFPASSCPQVERSRLIATYDAGCLRAGTHERHSKTCGPSKIADGRDRQYDWHASQPIESSGRDYEYGPLALLLVTYGGIERDEIDVAPFHNSRPDGVTSIQA